MQRPVAGKPLELCFIFLTFLSGTGLKDYLDLEYASLYPEKGETDTGSVVATVTCMVFGASAVSTTAPS